MPDPAAPDTTTAGSAAPGSAAQGSAAQGSAITDPAPGSPGADGTVGGGTATDTTAVTGTTAVTAEVQDPAPEPANRRRPGPPVEDRDGERGLRALVGSGSSQVGVGAAMRARDAARPSASELARAEEELVIVRRNWVPRDDLPRHAR